ncbi:hypothetical protein [Psychromonas sp. KJ10-2]|uniref:hypothetical protein n=1 Tax=Psychromonas sp. KJ10-2 TaxID=3391822 RepID=UPI0039B492F6
MKIKLPKKHSPHLAKKAAKAIKKIESGCATLRKTAAHGYQTCDLGGGERIVLLANTAFAFSSHNDYDKFISQRHCY